MIQYDIIVHRASIMTNGKGSIKIFTVSIYGEIIKNACLEINSLVHTVQTEH